MGEIMGIERASGAIKPRKTSHLEGECERQGDLPDMASPAYSALEPADTSSEHF